MNWKQIYDTKYEVSEEGQVRSIKTKQIKKLYSGGTSVYLLVTIYVANGKRKSYLVHRLVAKYFIDNPENKTQVNHIDKNKLNNVVSNLEWVTPVENMKHHYDNGGVKRNNQTYKGKFGAEHNRSMKVSCNGVVYGSISEASRETGIAISSIRYCAINNKMSRSGILFKLEKSWGSTISLISSFLVLGAAFLCCPFVYKKFPRIEIQGIH